MLTRALKGAQEGQLQIGSGGENRMVLASRVAKYGAPLTSQVRADLLLKVTDTECTAHEARTFGTDRAKATRRPKNRKRSDARVPSRIAYG